MGGTLGLIGWERAGVSFALLSTQARQATMLPLGRSTLLVVNGRIFSTTITALG
jgi:hypothetical protein